MVSAGIRTPDHTTELFCLTCSWVDVKYTYIKYQCPCLQVIRQYAHIMSKLPNCENFWAICCVKIAATSTVDMKDFFCQKCDKNSTIEGKPECSKKLRSIFILSFPFWEPSLQCDNLSILNSMDTCFNVIKWIPCPLIFCRFHLVL